MPFPMVSVLRRLDRVILYGCKIPSLIFSVLKSNLNGRKNLNGSKQTKIHHEKTKRSYLLYKKKLDARIRNLP